MRGSTARQVTMLAVLDADQLIPAEHPIRRIKPIVEEALRELEPIFAGMYSEVGRRSIPPEHLLKACLLMAFLLDPERAPVLRAAAVRASRERLTEVPAMLDANRGRGLPTIERINLGDRERE